MSDKIAELEARLANLPAGDEHARERVDILNSLGWEVREQADWTRALELADQAMDLSQRCSYQQGLCGAFRNSAFAHYMLSNYKAALAEALVALRMAEELDDTWARGHALSVLSLVHWSLGNYDQALEEAIRGVQLVEKTDDPWGRAWGYTIIGGIYETIGDHQKSLAFHQKSHELFAQEKYRLGEARSLSGMGSVYQSLGDTDGALECHEKALGIYREIRNEIGEARAFNDIGEIRLQQGRLDESLDLHSKSLALREKVANQQAQTTSLLNLGRVYLRQPDYERAESVLNRALDIAVEIGAKPKASRAHELLSRLYENTGDFQAALRHERSFHEFHEQVFNEETNTKLKNLQIASEVERSEREAEIHRLRNVDLKEKNDELARLLHELQVTQAQLVHGETMSALGDLVAAIAHEINTPLGAIRTAADISRAAAERVVEAIELSETVEELKSRRSVQATVSALRKNGKLITDASDRISHMIKSLKSFARLDQAAFQEFCLNEAVRDSLAVLEPSVPPRIRIEQDCGELPPIYGYPAEVNQVVLNLLRNATEAIENEGAVQVRTFRENGHQCVQVADNGRGMPQEQQERLFAPGFSARGTRVKASMSLFTSANIAQKHRGEISVVSKEGEGSTFTLKMKGLDATEESAARAADPRAPVTTEPLP